MSDLILASTKTGMVSFKENFELSFINDSALKILGLEKNESDGERIINLLGSIVKEGINQAFKKDNTFTFDSLNVIVNGKERYLNVTILPYYDPVGEKTVLITIDDVTENVKLIKEAQRDYSQLELHMKLEIHLHL
jgi:PAS domain S-box-containing protein